jgi:hypothetical protein
MKHLLIISGWFIGMMLTLFVSLFTIHTVSRTQELPALIKTQVQAAKDEGVDIAHISGVVKGVSTAVQTGDARPIIIAEFLEIHDSPLKPYDYFGKILTQIADKYKLDYRLLPAIAMQESNLCKVIPNGTYNCLGLGIHSQGTWGFDSYESNFDTAARILRENYLDEGLITPDEIQDKYTPGSNGSWEFAVNQFMDQLETAEF